MNFNYISKAKIDKETFDNYFRDNDMNYNQICIYFYKIATIIANQYGIRNQHIREDLIQDSVYIAYKRSGNYDLNHNKSAYSYFYKVILNNFKDIMRKGSRRNNKVKMVSYETTEDNVVKINVFTDKKLNKMDINYTYSVLNNQRNHIQYADMFNNSKPDCFKRKSRKYNITKQKIVENLYKQKDFFTINTNTSITIPYGEFYKKQKNFIYN